MTKKQRIKKLEREVARLRAEVQKLRTPYQFYWYRDTTTVPTPYQPVWCGNTCDTRDGGVTVTL